MRPYAGDADEPEAPAVSLAALVAALAACQNGHAVLRHGAIEQLDRWLLRGYEPPRPAHEEARLISAARWMLNDRAEHPVIPVWAARAAQVLRELDDEALAVPLANFSFEYFIRVGDFASAGRLVAEMWDRTAANHGARMTWLPSAALYLWLSGRPQAALAALLPAIEDPSVDVSLRHALLEQAASAALAAGESERCAAFLDDAETSWDALSPQDRAHAWFLRAGTAAVDGDSSRASAAMTECEAIARDVTGRFFIALWRLGGATVRVHCGQARRAERELSELLGDVVLMRARYLEWSVRLARAAARFALQRRPAGESDLAAALRIAAENGYVVADPWGFTPALRTLLRDAVERGIEAPTARAILAHAHAAQ